MKMTGNPVLDELIKRSRTLGQDQTLVVYGGGNTSAKGVITDHLGREREVIWVKGSGSDLRNAEVEDFPALKLDELLQLRNFAEMSDDQMVDLVTRSLIDPSSKRPSIETLLHAFLPYRHIDHVHANAICALTNHADGRQITKEALGENIAYIDWMRPGFELSQIVSNLASYEGVVLAHHGLITWSDSSQGCADRTMEVVGQAEAFIRENTRRQEPAVTRKEMTEPEAVKLLVRIRGALSATGRRVLHLDDRLREISDSPLVKEIVEGGTASADHMLRIKPFSLVVENYEKVTTNIDNYVREYCQYFERHIETVAKGPVMHDPMPRVVLVPGLGGITSGSGLGEARAAADIALQTHTVASNVLNAFGTPQALTEKEIFDFDYWPMELYKLSLKPQALQFSGHITIVTGAASGIGRGIARLLASRGSSLVLADINGEGMEQTASIIRDEGGLDPVCVVGDQSDESVVTKTIHAAVRAFGGIDGVVINAGVAVPGNLSELSLGAWENAQKVNLTSAFLLTKASISCLREQGIGGSLVYVASKNAFSPGAGFGAYSVSKAGMIQLMRIAALEGGEYGIRANAVNPDAVFDDSKLWHGGIREERAASHGIAPSELEEFYASRNLLSVRVSTSDVAETVAHLLSDGASRTSGGVIPVDGGVPGAFVR